MKGFINLAILFSIFLSSYSYANFQENSSKNLLNEDEMLTLALFTENNRSLGGKIFYLNQINLDESDPNEVSANCYSSGFIPGEQFTSYITKTTTIKKIFYGDVIANDNGELVLIKDDKNPIPLSKCTFDLFKFGRGEGLCYILFPKDRSFCLITTFIPNPIETRWNDEAHVSMIRLGNGEGYFIIQGKGFKPFEECFISGVSSKKSHIQAKENGTWSFLYQESKYDRHRVKIERSQMDETRILNTSVFK